jgi:hypothetical protein
MTLFLLSEKLYLRDLVRRKVKGLLGAQGRIRVELLNDQILDIEHKVRDLGGLFVLLGVKSLVILVLFLSFVKNVQIFLENLLNVIKVFVI